MMDASELKPYQVIFLYNYKNPPLHEIIKTIIYDLISKHVLNLTNDEFIVKGESKGLDAIERLIVSSLIIAKPIKLDSYLKEITKFLDKRFTYIDKKYNLEKQLINYFLEIGLIVKKKLFFMTRYEPAIVIDAPIEEATKMDVLNSKTNIDVKFQELITGVLDSQLKKGNSNLDITAMQYLK